MRLFSVVFIFFIKYMFYFFYFSYMVMFVVNREDIVYSYNYCVCLQLDYKWFNINMDGLCVIV